MVKEDAAPGSSVHLGPGYTAVIVLAIGMLLITSLHSRDLVIIIFDVLRAVTIKVTVFWHVTPCHLAALFYPKYGDGV
jgi:hypothetical protein